MTFTTSINLLPRRIFSPLKRASTSPIRYLGVIHPIACRLRRPDTEQFKQTPLLSRRCMSSDSGKQSVTTILYNAQLSNNLGRDSPPTNGRHILSIELGPRTPQAAGGGFAYSSDSERDASRSIEQKIIEQINQLVAQDKQAVPSERIDSVRIGPTDGNEPTKEMCQALGGLSPSHLTIHAGWDEEANFVHLNDLQHRWIHLQSLSVQGQCRSVADSSELPIIFSQISSLTLSYCCAFNFIPPGGTTNLKHLRIEENDAFDMFIMAFDGNPALAETLEVLDLESTNGCDFALGFEPEDLRNRLTRCTNLRELRLAVGHQDGLDTNLASYIPSSVEKVVLTFSRSIPFLANFDDWIDHAKDTSWLPRLKSFHMTIDTKSKVSESQEPRSFSSDVKEPIHQLSVASFDLAFEAKRKELYELLRSTRPRVDLIS
ncbi:hypothetical protein BDZ97DRAFT_1824861 [Flammula alnicola]|nr:hypothetical protein BDZ97DRAFT_1824861 [Flammula alnicola]